MKLCIYHGNCADGFAAAWVVRRFWQQSTFDEVEFFPANYGDVPPDVTGKDVVIVDFSYPRGVLMEMEWEAEKLLVIDHHKTAREALTGLDFVKFDMEKSGAILAWRNFFSSEPPVLLHYIQDRDLWTWSMPDSRAVSAAIASYPYDFSVWDNLMKRPIPELVIEGESILRYQGQVVRRHLENVVMIEMDGYAVPCVNATTMISEIGNELCQGHPFAVSYFDTAEKRVFSLRSAGDGVDMAEIAKKHGGGGHKHAAGFTAGSPEIF